MTTWGELVPGEKIDIKGITVTFLGFTQASVKVELPDGTIQTGNPLPGAAVRVVGPDMATAKKTVVDLLGGVDL